jgi:hypothetical protein
MMRRIVDGLKPCRLLLAMPRLQSGEVRDELVDVARTDVADPLGPEIRDRVAAHYRRVCLAGGEGKPPIRPPCVLPQPALGVVVEAFPAPRARPGIAFGFRSLGIRLGAVVRRDLLATAARDRDETTASPVDPWDVSLDQASVVRGSTLRLKRR